MTKTCNVCDKEKSLTEFYSSKKHSKKKGEYIYYNPECKKCTSERSLNWQKSNPENTSVSKRKYELTPRNKQLKSLRNEKTRKEGKVKEWRQSNPEKIKEYNLKTILHKKHEISKEEIKVLYEYANHCCMYCGITEKEAKSKYNNVLHKDHALNEGSNKIDNCVLACKSCNTSKRTVDWDIWFKTKDFFSEDRYASIKYWLEHWEVLCNKVKINS